MRSEPVLDGSLSPGRPGLPTSRPVSRGWAAVSHGHEEPYGRRNPRPGGYLRFHGVCDGDGDRARAPDGRRAAGPGHGPPLTAPGDPGGGGRRGVRARTRPHPAVSHAACSTCWRTPSRRSGPGSASSQPTRAARAGPAAASGASTSRSSPTTASSSGRWWAAAARRPASMSSSRTACSRTGWRASRPTSCSPRPRCAGPGVDPEQAGLLAHTERYEHFGEVRCFVRDLGEDVARAEESDDESTMEYAFAD